VPPAEREQARRHASRKLAGRDDSADGRRGLSLPPPTQPTDDDHHRATFTSRERRLHAAAEPHAR
jgi:hypothetical protein